jgi:hypothetical protein
MIAPLLLEVMDKEPSVQTVWLVAAGLGTLGYALARWRAWTITLSGGAIGLFAYSIMGEMRDPFVGPAIRQEAGPIYGWHVALACALALLFACAGRRSARVDSA